MLAGWMTIEARLATALLLVLLFAAGTLPSRQSQAVLVQVAAQVAPHTGIGSPAGKERMGAVAVIAERPAAEAGPLAAGPPEEISGSEELGLLNQDRLQAGIPALAESAGLDRIALTRAAQVISDGITHTRPGHSQLAAVELMQASGIRYLWHGENLIWEGGMPLGKVPGFFNDWWMASPVHRANILNPNYRSVGIGVAQSGDRVYMVEVFSDTLPLTVTIRQVRSRQPSRPN